MYQSKHKTHQNTLKETIKAINEAISNDLEGAYKEYLGLDVEDVGSNCRINPCPVDKEHNDCFTLTPGEVVYHCFSCGAKGTHVQLFLRLTGKPERELLESLCKRYSIFLPKIDEMQVKTQQIRGIAADFYHQQLLENVEALNHQTAVRKHKIELLKELRVGFSSGYEQLRKELLLKGFTNEEIKESLVWIPEGIFVYPYVDPETGFIRFNCKPMVKSDENKKGFSHPEKILLYFPGFSNESVIVCEGENDLISLVEAGADSVVATGGRPNDIQLKELERFKRVYLAFDNDSAGEEFTAIVNNSLPHIPVFRMEYSEDFKDPDEYLKNSHNLKTIQALLDKAAPLETDKLYFGKQGPCWVLANRKERLEFEYERRNRKGNPVGNVKFINAKNKVTTKYNIDLSQASGEIANFCHIMRTELEQFCNRGLEKRDFHQLFDIYRVTGNTYGVISELGKRLNEHEMDPDLVREVYRRLGKQAGEKILQEAMAARNRELINEGENLVFPKVKATCYTNVQNDDAYFYYTATIIDGADVRYVPCWLSNKKKTIRLDFLKRKDPQILLLIEGKYELQMQVPTAIIGTANCSLSQKWAERYINGQVDSSLLDIPKIISEIEQYIRRFVFFHDDYFYRVIAAWIFGTYCYELFGQYPYLLINGNKGTGKTVLDTVISHLALNAKLTVGMTEAALFRTVSLEGGTIILDELEGLTDREKGATYGTMLKAGYSDGVTVRRCNQDKNNQVDDFYVYGPKVISNIFGLEDIIADRCLPINMLYVKPDRLKGFDDPKLYEKAHLEEIRDLTSRCCLAVLEKFKDIYSIYVNAEFIALTPRLSQIMRPLMAIASIAGRQYMESIQWFYDTKVTEMKREIEEETIEGALAQAIVEVAKEIKGLIPENMTKVTRYRYKENIEFTEDHFIIDTLHAKMLVEDRLPDVKVSIRNLHSVMRRGLPFRTTWGKRHSLRYDNEDLIKEFGGRTEQTGLSFTIRFKDIQGLLEEHCSSQVSNPCDDEAIRTPHEEVSTDNDISLKKIIGKYQDF